MSTAMIQMNFFIADLRLSINSKCEDTELQSLLDQNYEIAT